MHVMSPSYNVMIHYNVRSPSIISRSSRTDVHSLPRYSISQPLQLCLSTLLSDSIEFTSAIRLNIFIYLSTVILTDLLVSVARRCSRCRCTPGAKTYFLERETNAGGGAVCTLSDNQSINQRFLKCPKWYATARTTTDGRLSLHARLRA